MIGHRFGYGKHYRVSVDALAAKVLQPFVKGLAIGQGLIVLILTMAQKALYVLKDEKARFVLFYELMTVVKEYSTFIMFAPSFTGNTERLAGWRCHVHIQRFYRYLPVVYVLWKIEMLPMVQLVIAHGL